MKFIFVFFLFTVRKFLKLEKRPAKGLPEGWVDPWDPWGVSEMIFCMVDTFSKSSFF